MDPESLQSVSRVEHGGTTESDVLDFSANVNPETPDGVESVYTGALENARRYPAEPPGAFITVAAEYVDVDPESIVPTPGGLAALRLAIETTIGPDDTVLVPAPSFGEYEREIRLQGAEPVVVPYDDLLRTDPAGVDLVVVCNPNNPTGDAYDRSALLEFANRCRQDGTTLLVDEAFLGFTEQPSLAGTPGTIVVRSLTKLFGLPGLRAGFAVATGKHGVSLETARRPWNVGTPALETGAYCMRQEDFIERTRTRVAAERERLQEGLASDFEVHPSDSPFLLLDVGDRRVDEVLNRAREEGVVLRDARTFRGLDSHVRVAVKGPVANDQLLEVLGDDTGVSP
ncbi:MAG: threonine-phosphate decarboxylase CobD [Halodesulfurarchaeum sp.]